MTVPPTRLFHLHYHVPDVTYTEGVLEDHGLPKRATFGTVDDEPVSLRPGETAPENFRFRLQDFQRGAANLTLTPGNEVLFDHFGVVTPEYDAALQRAREAGWTVNGADSHRTFLVTPWRFRIEVHPTEGRIPSSLGPPQDCRFTDVVLSVPDAEVVREGIESTVGGIPALEVRPRESGPPGVSEARLGGDAVTDGRVLRAADLGPDGDETR